jgi:putative ABC transport system ATP-binding protein
MNTGSEKSPADKVVELVDVQRHYHMGDSVVRALDGVSVTIREGEYWAIMGASGSGKSTLLNVLGCLDRPTAGTYRLGEADVSAISDDELSELRGKNLGFVFQSFHLIPQLTILENVEVPLFYQGVPIREGRRRAEKLLERVGLGDRLTHRSTELSGGQQQRVAVARALVNDPLVLLADEPTGNLDSKTSEDILSLFDELHAQNRTLILVTHDPAIANRATRVLHLHDGKIDRVEVGGTQKVGASS